MLGGISVLIYKTVQVYLQFLNGYNVIFHAAHPFVMYCIPYKHCLSQAEEHRQLNCSSCARCSTFSIILAAVPCTFSCSNTVFSELRGPQSHALFKIWINCGFVQWHNYTFFCLFFCNTCQAYRSDVSSAPPKVQTAF